MSSLILWVYRALIKSGMTSIVSIMSIAIGSLLALAGTSGCEFASSLYIMANPENGRLVNEVLA